MLRQMSRKLQQQITMAGSQDGLALLQSRVLGPGLGVSQASGIAHAGKQPLTGQTGQAVGVQLPQAAQAAASAATASAQATQEAAAAAAAAPTLAEGWSTVPPAARLLGLGGAIPFLCLSPPIASSLPFMPADLVANAGLLQVAYGATIASFLGGVHWGTAMGGFGGPLSARFATTRYLWGVTPCLMAWPAVTLPSGPASLVVGSTIGIAYMMDRHFTGQGLLPRWYMHLRLPLTILALSGLMTTLVTSLYVGDVMTEHVQIKEAEAAARLGGKVSS